MTDEEIFDLADDYGWQDDFGRWDFYPEGLVNFALALAKRIAKAEKQDPVAWRCPLKRKDCVENCGSYGCGN